MRTFHPKPNKKSQVYANNVFISVFHLMIIILISVKPELCPGHEECMECPNSTRGFSTGHRAIALALWGKIKRCDKHLKLEICLGKTETTTKADITSFLFLRVLGALLWLSFLNLSFQAAQAPQFPQTKVLLEQCSPCLLCSAEVIKLHAKVKTIGVILGYT